MKSALGTLLSIPIFSLLLMPAYYAGAKLVRAKKRSFGASFLLVLITGAVLQVCVLFLPSIPPTDSPWLDFGMYLCLYALLAGFVFGYLVRNENNESIGVGKGMAMAVVFCVVGALILPVLSAIAVGVLSVFP